MHAKQRLVLSLTLLVVGASQTAFAADSDTWQFEVTPYVFAAGMNGTVGIRGVTSQANKSFDDILGSLDQGFMGLAMASRGPWTYSLEAVYMKLGDDSVKSVTGPFGQVTVKGALSVTSKMYVYQGTVGYRVLDSTTVVDLIGALRHTRLDSAATVKITTTPNIVFPGAVRSASGSVNWTDAVVGARIVHPISDKLALFGYADIGAGGSKLTYQVMAGVNWTFAKNFTAKVGYRQLYWDYASGGTVWNMTASGPYLGLGIRF